MLNEEMNFSFLDLLPVSTKNRCGSGCTCFQGSLTYTKREVPASHGEM